MLLDHNIVADGEAKAGPFSGGFRREEGIEHLFFHFSWNTGAIVANPDFDAIAKALGRGSEGWHVIAAVRFRLALDRCIEAVRDKVQQRPRDVLREHVGCTSGGIQCSLEGDGEALLLGPRPVIGAG